MRKTLWCLTALLMLSATPALAQTGTPTNYILRVYNGTSTTLVGTPLTIPASAVLCNQVKVTATPPTLNPTEWRWNDPANPTTRDCVFNDATRLTALADGAYEGTASASNADGESAESNRFPFVRRRPNPPAAPSGLRLTP